jgi:RHS repeat-associated protein
VSNFRGVHYTKDTTYTYNLDGSVATLTYPSGRMITYSLQYSGSNTAGRFASAVDSTGPINYATGATYAPQGALSSLTNGASLVSAFYYNSRLQPCRISVKNSGTAPASCTGAAIGNVLDFSYNFSLGTADNGNVTAITNNLDNLRSQSFTYDALNRLATAQTNATAGTSLAKCWGESFAYDPWGNLLTIGASSTAYTGCTQEGLSVAATTKNQISGDSYDAAGNLITIPSTAGYIYNAENQLTTTAGITYTYDGDGKRVQKSSGKLYWYGAGSDALDETDLAGNTNNSTFDEYVFFNGKRIARRDYLNNVSYYFADHLGTARVVTDAAGTVLDDSDFYPFGGERSISSTSGNRYKFTGKERDAETGLDYFGARYDSSNMGRFMSPDAFYKDSHVGDPQSWNEYAYARNNPLRYVDPTGENATVSTSCTTDANSHTTCNVNISASIAIYAAPGSNLTQDQLNQAAGTIQNSIQNAWTGSTTQDGVTYNVTTQVSVSVAGSQDAAMSSGAQNVIGMTNGPPQAGVGAYVNPKSLWGALTGAPDTGMMDINHADNYAKHEFTHLLGTYDKGGAVLSNTNPAMRPFGATSQDYGWGIREATSGVNSWINAPQFRSMRYGEVWEM